MFIKNPVAGSSRSQKMSYKNPVFGSFRVNENFSTKIRFFWSYFRIPWGDRKKHKKTLGKMNIFKVDIFGALGRLNNLTVTFSGRSKVRVKIHGMGPLGRLNIRIRIRV